MSQNVKVFLPWFGNASQSDNVEQSQTSLLFYILRYISAFFFPGVYCAVQRHMLPTGFGVKVLFCSHILAYELIFAHTSRYFLRATVSRRLNDISKELDIVVHTLSTYPELNSSIKMEVGIEDCLHIEFEYNKSKYD